MPLEKRQGDPSEAESVRKAESEDYNTIQIAHMQNKHAIKNMTPHKK
jgi:hypothetical protein